MNDIIAITLCAIFVTISHACALLFARNHQSYPYQRRERLWYMHLVCNGIFWIILWGWAIVIQWYLPHTITTPPWLQILGIISVITGIIFVVQARLALGHDQAMGLRFFLPEKAIRVVTSIYRFLRNPMYDGFILVFMGLGLALGIAADLYLALVSFTLFNVLLASVENYEWSWNPF